MFPPSALAWGRDRSATRLPSSLTKSSLELSSPSPSLMLRLPPPCARLLCFMASAISLVRFGFRSSESCTCFYGDISDVGCSRWSSSSSFEEKDAFGSRAAPIITPSSSLAWPAESVNLASSSSWPCSSSSFFSSYSRIRPWMPPGGRALPQRV